MTDVFPIYDDLLIQEVEKGIWKVYLMENSIGTIRETDIVVVREKDGAGRDLLSLSVHKIMTELRKKANDGK